MRHTRSEINRLEVAMTASTATIAVSFDLRGVKPGSVLRIDNESLYVWDVASQTAVVERGWDNTTAVAHAVGAVVEINPRFHNDEITDALLDDVRAWPETIFRVVTLQADIGATERAINLPVQATTVLRVLRAQRDQPTGTYATLPDLDVRLDRSQPVGSFASGNSIVLQTPELGRAATLYITLAVKFNLSTWTDATDVESTVGLSTSLLDIPPLGAAARLLGAAEAARSDPAAIGPQEAADVPATATSKVADWYWGMWRRRLSDEEARLGELYGVRG